jgi:ABC-type nitrate/sulfonate/bicarbonate transport system substrate-binding protein
MSDPLALIAALEQAQAWAHSRGEEVERLRFRLAERDEQLAAMRMRAEAAELGRSTADARIEELTAKVAALLACAEGKT